MLVPPTTKEPEKPKPCRKTAEEGKKKETAKPKDTRQSRCQEGGSRQGQAKARSGERRLVVTCAGVSPRTSSCLACLLYKMVFLSISTPSLIGKEISSSNSKWILKTLKLVINGYFVHSAGVAKSFGMEGKAGGGPGIWGPEVWWHPLSAVNEWPTEKQRLENKRLPFLFTVTTFHVMFPCISGSGKNRINSAGCSAQRT